MALLDSYSEANADQYADLANTVSHAQGQAITLASGYTYLLTSAKFYIAKNGAPTGNVYAKVYVATGTVGTDGAPTGSILVTSDAVDVTGIAAGPALVTFTFSTPVVLSAGGYCLECYFSGGDYAGGKYIGVGDDGSSPSHYGNHYSRNSSDVVFGNNNGGDCVFYLYGTKVPTGGSFLFKML